MPTRDPGLPHQVIIDATSSLHQIVVSCNCRKRADLENIGLTGDRLTTQRLYNNPHNHVGDVPFTTDDEIHYKDLEGHTNGQRRESLQQGTADRDA